MKGRMIFLLLVVCLLAVNMPSAALAEDTGEAESEDSVLILNDTDEPVLWQDEENAENEETDKVQDEALFSTTATSDDESAAATLDSDLISYTSSSTVTMQIANEQRNGIYFLSSKTLKFYSLDDGSYSTVYTFSGCKSAYAEGDKLYVLYSTNCYVYDLNENELSDTISFSDIYSEDTVSSLTAIGADPSGRIYVATSGTADSESIYQIYLCSSDGTVLSSAALDAQIYSFSGFDPDNGNFFMEGYYNWVYWGYDHPGRGVYMGNVTDDEVSFVNTSGSVTMSGIVTYTLSCLEYICQSSYYLHQKGADVIGGRYLVTASTTYGRVYVADTDTLTATISLSRSAIEETQSSTYYDVNSIGVRTVYNEANDTIVIYENEKTLNEYDPDSGEIIGTYETAHYVFNLLTLGDYVIAIEKEDGQFYMELINWAAPVEFSIIADSETMKAGESQTLSISCDTDYQSSYTWSSSDSSVVSVTAGGKVTAWKEGEAVITYTSPDGAYSASVTITVSGSIISENATLRNAADGVITNNISDNNYTYWSSVVNSYIIENSDETITRLEYTDGSVLVETYSEEYELITTNTLTAELSLFGGFYAGEDYNYLVFGQSNADEDDTLEVLLVVKYSKSWSRVSSCSISAINTYIPFDAGSLRMTELDGQLYIYTCHEMYESSDGYNHQANMTFVIDEDAMTVTDSYYEVMNNSYGYVSHSFNQFIQTDGEYIFRVDHGDAYPRGVYLSRIDAGDSITSVSYSTVFSFQGSTGANATGASVGGFELSDDNCLIVGNSVDQSSSSTYSASGQRNIFLIITDKDYLTSEKVWLTDYSSTDGVTPRTPQLVKISDDQFLVMWEEYYSSTKTVLTRMVTINGDGEQTSEIISACVRLSDCQPTVTSDGYVVWYVTDGSECVFYQINPYDLESVQQESHNYETVVTEPTCTEQGYTTYTCTVCGDVYISDYTEASGHTAGDTVIENEAAASCSTNGSYDETVYCTVCGEELSRETVTTPLTSHTEGEAVQENAVAATCTENGSYENVIYCTVCGVELSRETVTVETTGHTEGEAVQENAAAATCTENGSCESVVYCTVCGIELSRETVTIEATGHDYDGNVCTVCGALKNGNLSGAVISSISDQTYTGSEIRPSVSVKLNGTTLTSGTDYTVSYSDNTDAGTATVTVTGQGTYTGTATKTFKISAQELSSSGVSLSYTSKPYTGKSLTPAVTVKNSAGSKLTKNTDYTISYSKSARKKVGTYTITIKGKGNYTGTVTKTYKITKASQTLKVTTSTRTVKYSKLKKAKQTVTAIKKVTGAKGTLTYKKISGSSKLTISKSTGKITVKKGTKKGTYKIKVKVTSAATSNYKSAGKTVTLTVKVK